MRIRAGRSCVVRTLCIGVVAFGVVACHRGAAFCGTTYHVVWPWHDFSFDVVASGPLELVVELMEGRRIRDIAARIVDKTVVNSSLTRRLYPSHSTPECRMEAPASYQ